MSEIQSVKVYPSNLTIKAGNWYHDAYAEVQADPGETKAVTWSSSNTDVAIVNASSGYIYAKAPGTAKIYAVANGDAEKTDHLTVTVTATALLVNDADFEQEVPYLEDENLALLTPRNSVATMAYNACGGSSGGGSQTPPKILVTSVSVLPSERPMTVGKSAYLYEMIVPSNATNQKVRWSSSNENIATVNPDSGFVYAKKEGVVTIKATATDGSGKSGTCVITVEPPIHVTSVTVSPKNATVRRGETMYCSVSFTPKCGVSDTRVNWTSSNPSVATIDIATGRVYAHELGKTTIRATSLDGCHSDSLTLTVVIDKVTIQKDGESNKVVFEKTGKTWYCINKDMIFDDNNRTNDYLEERFKQNYFVAPDDSDEVRTYTDEEFKLLYAIDPHGVAAYVQTFAESKFREHGLEGILEYKDHVFKVLFGRDPHYFIRVTEDTWGITRSWEDPRGVASESETIFGVHTIIDDYTMLNVLEFVYDVLKIVLPFSSFWEAIDMTYDIAKTVILLLLSTDEEEVKRELSQAAADDVLEKALEENHLKWAYNFITLFGDLKEIVDDLLYQPNFYFSILDYCANKTGYDVSMVLKGDKKVKLSDICAALAG